MPPVASVTSVKLVGNNGQISIGKQHAGRQVLVEEREPGVWLVRTAMVVPDNERWAHAPEAAANLREALAWSQSNAPADKAVVETLKRLRNG